MDTKQKFRDNLTSSLQAERESTHIKMNELDKRFSQAAALASETYNPKIVDKVIKDTFCFPKEDHELMNQLKMRLLSNSHSANKSEIVRAGVLALSRMDDTELLSIIKGLSKQKPGRR